jgi:DNA-binding transcriptional MocR family regulator
MGVMEQINTLYRSVAERVAHLIEHGTFRAGDRLPSVRRLSGELKVSITTVLEAYANLESQGLIEARPQSGYYVRPRLAPTPEIKPSRPPLRPSEVGVDELIMRVMNDMADQSLVQLGAAIPNPDLLPTQRLNRLLASAARRLQAQGNLYDVPPGCEALRIQIAQRTLEAGCTLLPDEIMTTNGCLEAVNLALRALCQPGDTVAIESPTYWGLLQTIQLLGLRVLEIPTHPRNGIDLDALQTAIGQNDVKAAIVMSNYNNPLGSLMSDDDKKALVRMLGQHKIPLIEDDIYGDMCFSPERPKVAKSYDRDGMVILCSSFSKDLAPGYRVGWMAAGRFHHDVCRLKAATNIANATLPQMAIADFLASGGYDHHLRRIRRIYESQVALVAQAVLKYFPEGTKVTNPAGGFVLWVELPKKVDSLELYEQGLREGITLAPGPMFSAKGRYRNYIRLNCAYWSERVERALISLGQITATLERSAS